MNTRASLTVLGVVAALLAGTASANTTYKWVGPEYTKFDLNGTEVASRAHYLGSHLEFEFTVAAPIAPNTDFFVIRSPGGPVLDWKVNDGVDAYSSLGEAPWAQISVGSFVKTNAVGEIIEWEINTQGRLGTSNVLLVSGMCGLSGCAHSIGDWYSSGGWIVQDPATFGTVSPEVPPSSMYSYFVPGAGTWSMVTTPAVPEPESYAMFLAGLGIVGAMTRRKR